MVEDVPIDDGAPKMPKGAVWDDGKPLRECCCSTESNPVFNTREQYALHLKTDADGKNPHNINMEKRKGISQK